MDCFPSTLFLDLSQQMTDAGTQRDQHLINMRMGGAGRRVAFEAKTKSFDVIQTYQ
ncbi:hypothetical protein Bpfe_022936, partial [Biomphalaria pfeifferi]